MTMHRILVTTTLFASLLATSVPVLSAREPRGGLDALSLSSLRGVVLAFDRNTCPRGWEEYVALRGRSIVGVNPAKPGGASGNGLPVFALGVDYGAPTLSLTTAQLPPHTHPYNDIYYSESFGPSDGGAVPVPDNLGSRASDQDNAGRQIARTSGETGGGQPVPIQPPARALLYCKLL